jgi:hypothetical protein
VDLLSRARKCELDKVPYCVAGRSLAVALYLRELGCLYFWFSKVRLTARGRFVADEQGWHPNSTGNYRRLTFDREAFYKLSADTGAPQQ